MSYAGNDPATGILRWGNFSSTLLLPSTIFEPDDTGRSYRLRPHTRGVWLRNLTIQRIPLTFFLVPEGPDLEDAMCGTTAVLVPGSLQTTNSWGLRGPEPDAAAPLRGIVIGDSFMQGLFIADDQTPSECLRRVLESRRKTKASILNTGHLGYSPEQEYYTLEEYAPRFQPRFVVLGLFANDFGGVFEVAAGSGDWAEGKYWLDQIDKYCRTHGMLLLTIPARRWRVRSCHAVSRATTPDSSRIFSTGPSMFYLDPIEPFVNEHLGRMVEGEARASGRPRAPCSTVSSPTDISPPSARRLWARVVGVRLGLLLDQANEDQSSRP